MNCPTINPAFLLQGLSAGALDRRNQLRFNGEWIKEIGKKSARKKSLLLQIMPQLQRDQLDVAESGSGDIFWPQLPVLKDKSTLVCLPYTHRHTHYVSNSWLTLLIHSPPTYNHHKKDVFSLLSFHAYISNTSRCNKTVKNPSPWKCNTPWGKHDESGSAGTNIPRVLFISRSMSIYFSIILLLFLHRGLNQLCPFFTPFFTFAAHWVLCCPPGQSTWLLTDPCPAQASAASSSKPNVILQQRQGGSLECLPGSPDILYCIVCRVGVNNCNRKTGPQLSHWC